MEPRSEQSSCHVGATVSGSDEGKVDRVTAVDARFLTVEPSLLQKEELCVPRSAINAGEADTVSLTMDKHAALYQR